MPVLHPVCQAQERLGAFWGTLNSLELSPVQQPFPDEPKNRYNHLRFTERRDPEMNRTNIGEYDNYALPEPVKEESPESRTRLAELFNEAKAMAERHHKEAAEFSGKNSREYSKD